VGSSDRKQPGLIPVIAVLVARWCSGTGIQTVASRAQQRIASRAPNGQAPNGSRWQYRTDPVKQTKCWYLRAEGEAISQKPAVQEKQRTVHRINAGAATVTISGALRTGRCLISGSIQGGSQLAAKRAPQVGIGRSSRLGPVPTKWRGLTSSNPPAPGKWRGLTLRSASASKVAWPDLQREAVAPRRGPIHKIPQRTGGT